MAERLGYSMAARKGRVLAGIAAALALPCAQAQAASRELVFVSQAFPPFIEQSEDGRVSGALVTILQEACRRLNWRCSMQMMVWKRALLMIEQGKADGMLLAQDAPERRATMELSLPVLSSRYGLYVQSGATFGYRKAADLAGHAMAVYGPSLSQTNCQRLIQGVPGVALEVEKDPETVLRKLSAGRYGAQGVAFSNEDIARYWIAQDGISNLKRLASVQALRYHYGFTRSRLQPGTVEAFNHALEAMCRDGTLKRLAEPSGVRLASCR
nr:transporter substrate-binding domain-containing protein [Chromobacterium sp. ASV5]